MRDLCGIRGRSATALSLCAVGLGSIGSLRDPTFPDQFSRLSTDKLSQCLSSVPKPHREALQKIPRYFSKRNGEVQRPNSSPRIQLGKLMGSQTLSTTKSFGAARQVFSVCLFPAIPRGNTDTLWKELCHGNAPGETLPHCPAHDITPNGTTVTSVTHQPLNNQTVLPALPGPSSSPSCSRIPHWAQDQGTQTAHYCK